MGKLRCFLGFGPYLLKLGVVIQFSAFSHLLSVVGGTFPRLFFVGPIVIFVGPIETLLGVLSSLLSLPCFVPFFPSFLPRERKIFFLFKGVFYFFFRQARKKKKN